MVAFEVPNIPVLLTVSSLLFLLNVAEALFSYLLEAGLIGSIAIGIIFGPEVSNIVPEFVERTFLVLGYIGLLLLVFEAGLDTNLSLLYPNLALSLVVGGTGIILPIVFSILVLHFGYEYTVLVGFAAGASLSSTSLGTTLALLKPELRQTKMGVVLLSAALFDDVVGLVIAAIISDLSSSASSAESISWQEIVRPILVSIAFTVGAGVLIWTGRLLFQRIPLRWSHLLYQGRTQVLIIVLAITGSVAAANYAGTSELYGAYLAGVFISQTHIHPPNVTTDPAEVRKGSSASTTLSSGTYSPNLAFTVYLRPILEHMLSPIFFSSIGSSLPIRSLGSINGSSRVVWRGWVYALLMVVAKALTGFWFLIWPDHIQWGCWIRCKRGRRDISSVRQTPAADAPPVLSRVKSAVLLGSAMVARGEIALIVAQLARPLLTRDSEEPFAVVIWAILVDTIGGALCVGLLLRREAKLQT